jgi:quinol monooxygenase YgiN
MVFFGAMTAGSTVWGLVAQSAGIEPALVIAAIGGSIAGLALARLVKLPAGTDDLTPSHHWPDPASAAPVPGDRGPVLVTITYRIDPADRRAFLDAVRELARIRRRDGAFGWRVLEDAEDPTRFEEIFFAASWLEHLRHHRRVTRADAGLQAGVNRFHRGETPPVVRHLVGADPRDEPLPAMDHDHHD